MTQVKKLGQKAKAHAKAKAQAKAKAKAMVKAKAKNMKPSKKAKEPEPSDDEHEDVEESEFEDDEEVEPLPMKRPAARTQQEEKAPKAKVAADPEVEPAREKKAPIVIPSVALGPSERVNSGGAEALEPKDEILSQPPVPAAQPQTATRVHEGDADSGAPLKRSRTEGESQWPPEPLS